MKQSRIVVLPNGVKIVNTTPHPLKFKTKDGVLMTVPPCGFVLNAHIEESIIHTDEDIEFVTATFRPTVHGLGFIEKMPDDVVILGSLIAAKAYPMKVAMPVPYDKSVRGESSKWLSVDKFTMFEEDRENV